jgi:hypothetical protein
MSSNSTGFWDDRNREWDSDTRSYVFTVNSPTTVMFKRDYGMTNQALLEEPGSWIRIKPPVQDSDRISEVQWGRDAHPQYCAWSTDVEGM